MSAAEVSPVLQQGTAFIWTRRASVPPLRHADQARGLYEPQLVLLSEVSAGAKTGEWCQPLRSLRDT